MNQPLNDLIEQLRQTNLRLLRESELAEAGITEVNEQLRRLAASGLGETEVVLGEVILQTPYMPALGPSDSSQVYQSALVMPEGIGVVVWDMEDLVALHKNSDPDSDAVARFLPFVDCNRVVKGLLNSQLVLLLEQFHELIVSRTRQAK